MQLSCEICKELMPLYTNGTLSAETAKLVEEHLLECEACRSYRDIVTNMAPSPITEEIQETSDSITHLKNRLLFTQGLFLALGLLFCFFISFSSNIFQTILPLFLIGFLGYLFTYKLFLCPLLATIITVIPTLLEEGSLFSTDTLMRLLVFSFLYFLLALMGSALALATVSCSKDFKKKSTLGRLSTILVWIVVLTVGYGFWETYDDMNGNPLSALHAQTQLEKYMEITYPGKDITVQKPSYNFKDKAYSSKAFVHGESTPQTFSASYKRGRIWDNYFTLYLEDIKNSHRLSKEAAAEIKMLLEDNAIGVNEVTCSLQVAKNTYDDIPFDKALIKEPLGITITQLTDTKVSYEAFTLWCESIRQILSSSGYAIEDIQLESDPHFMINRASLHLMGDELSTPITDATTLKGFMDYGVANGIDDMTDLKDSFNKESGKFETYYNDELSAAFAQAATNKGLIIDSIEVSSYEDVIDIDVAWFGKRISPDAFAANCLFLRDEVLKDPLLLKEYNVNNVNFSYYWGTSYESYHYSLYDSNFLSIDQETMVNNLLNDEKDKSLYNN